MALEEPGKENTSRKGGVAHGMEYYREIKDLDKGLETWQQKMAEAVWDLSPLCVRWLLYSHV